MTLDLFTRAGTVPADGAAARPLAEDAAAPTTTDDAAGVVGAPGSVARGAASNSPAATYDQPASTVGGQRAGAARIPGAGPDCGGANHGSEPPGCVPGYAEGAPPQLHHSSGTLPPDAGPDRFASGVSGPAPSIDPAPPSGPEPTSGQASEGSSPCAKAANAQAGAATATPVAVQGRPSSGVVPPDSAGGGPCYPLGPAEPLAREIHPDRNGGADVDARLRGYAFRFPVGWLTLEGVEAVARVERLLGPGCWLEAARVDRRRAAP